MVWSLLAAAAGNGNGNVPTLLLLEEVNLYISNYIYTLDRVISFQTFFNYGKPVPMSEITR